ncbi:NADH:flavin oxidoreductase/NADH oxidase family protein [Stenotrophobium rhamnosiphilum]|uniref:NADH:flavin oxidoreductase n=1 Tax=Stenotrophobium rhamnosiphilum TaxID=2029166 RepID=A0A2T5MFV1_9GAMM|nr:NADH:flavin oxidoreductase/NADH oxidase family protein [Stenotrophobium rhamnosiphilum]PTU31436.1 NADH:flavin oxidoreductase [Stenotrophobium rhamnosiphilum]
MTSVLTQPFNLPCGATLPNRLCKAAMTEGLADEHLRPTERLNTLYRRWAEGGAGLLLTGNVLIDHRVLERPGNVAIDPATPDAEMMKRIKAWTQAGTSNNNHMWMQISHAGRQSPRYVTGTPMGPSAVQLDLLGNYAKPRALTEAEILDYIQRYAGVAATAREGGFTGVQIHSAHGYLLSSFLSPITNVRTDSWGGTLENRARMLIETVRATRKAVGADFPIGIKLNSDDFRKGGFNHEDCLQVVQWLNAEGVDLLEISGGTYEQPRLLGFDGKADSKAAEPQRESTKKREAYFLDYAVAIRKIAKMPMMVTGGFRTRAGMEAAISAGECDVIGLGRPLCTHADVPKQLLSGAINEAPAFEKNLRLGPGKLFSGTSPIFLFKIIHVLGLQGWYYQQIAHMADGGREPLQRGVFTAFVAYLWDEYTTAFRMHRARRAKKKT